MRPHFLQKKTESPAASSRTAYPSPPAKAEVSLTPSLVLSPQSLMALRGPRLPTHSNERKDGTGVIVAQKGHRTASGHSGPWNTDLLPCTRVYCRQFAACCTVYRAPSSRRSCSASDSEAETTAAALRTIEVLLAGDTVFF